MRKDTLSVVFIIFTLLFGGSAFAQAPGMLSVKGRGGPFQLFKQIKAIRCIENVKGSCDSPVYFDLNTETKVPPGDYIVGFENSLYPGYVRVNAGEHTILILKDIEVPSQPSEGKKVAVYRDFSSQMEQQKLFVSMFSLRRHFFRLEKENFGDLYLTGMWERDFVQRIRHDSCNSMKEFDSEGKRTSLGKETLSLCAVWINSKTPSDLAPLYEFKENGTFVEKWVTDPGIITEVMHPRYLVSMPHAKVTFVSVFPGDYIVNVNGVATRVNVPK